MILRNYFFKVTKPESFEQNYDGSDLVKNAEDYKARQKRFALSPVNDVFNVNFLIGISTKFNSVVNF